MCINVVLTDNFSRVTSTESLSIEDVYQMMDECVSWDSVSCGQGYISVSIYTDTELGLHALSSN